MADFKPFAAKIKRQFDLMSEGELFRVAIDGDALWAIDKEREAAKAEIEAVLYSITTTKKLFSVWPELASVPGLDLEPESTAGQQMVVSLASLNKTLGLPAETAAAAA